MFEKAAIAHKDLDNADPDLQNEVARILAELGKQDTHWDSFVFHEAAGELESYSLIERNTQDDSYFVHPLVQHWSGSTLGAGRNLMRKCATTVIWLSVSWGFQDEDFKYVPSQAFTTYHEEHGFTENEAGSAKGDTMSRVEKGNHVHYATNIPLWVEVIAPCNLCCWTRYQSYSEYNLDHASDLAQIFMKQCIN
jgi:hypothetical protein